VGCKIQHPESVQQGPSTAIGVPDLRSKQGEFQPKTVQPLRHSTARSASSHHTRRLRKPGTGGHTALPGQQAAWAPPRPRSQRAGPA